MLVFAVPGELLKITGLEHEVPLLAIVTAVEEKPLSVAKNPFSTFTA